ncbi:hypothetical protein N1030_02370 [Desulfovibrio mangrovi]|uniref:hypothetical protein n=1 Tax=Desulfovibrio mangrovi TaxID=2976983 RepID=UPI00224682E9|nr:hypothetical protein [Desulfovibrio mangrovi]UZP67839.1 hypothetical protein N1030_02370 [Desulfovibrio mangrovi]
MFQSIRTIGRRALVLGYALAGVLTGAASMAYAAPAVEEGAAPSEFMVKLEAFINTKWGQYALIFVFFLMIIGYLRILFGPKGFFREKKWDEWNEEARRKEAEAKAAREAMLAEAKAGKRA